MKRVVKGAAAGSAAPPGSELTMNASAAAGWHELEAPPLSLSRLAWLRFRRHKMAMVGLSVLVFLLLYSIVGALIFSEKDANYNDTSIALQRPSRSHPFGTDTIGRDILARTIYGGQISLLIGLFAVTIEVTVGILVGALSGFFGGWLDATLMRFTEAVLIIPQIFLLLVMAKYFAGNIPDVTILGRTFSGSVIVIVVIIGLTILALPGAHRARRVPLDQGARVYPGGARHRHRHAGRHLPPHPAQLRGSDRGLSHAGTCKCDHARGLHQLPGAGGAPADGHLGQHARRRLQLHRNRLLAVAVPGIFDPADRPFHQLSLGMGCEMPWTRAAGRCEIQ